MFLYLIIFIFSQCCYLGSFASFLPCILHNNKIHKMLLTWASEVQSCNSSLRICSMTKAEDQILGDALDWLEFFSFPLNCHDWWNSSRRMLLGILQRTVMKPWRLFGFLVDFCFAFFLALLCSLDNHIFCCVFLRCFENKLIILSLFDLKTICTLQLYVQSSEWE